MTRLKAMLQDRGATAVEYAILASAIAAAIVMVAGAVGLKTQALFATLTW